VKFKLIQIQRGSPKREHMDRTKEFEDLIGGRKEVKTKAEEDAFSKTSRRVLGDLDRISDDVGNEEKEENVMSETTACLRRIGKLERDVGLNDYRKGIVAVLYARLRRVSKIVEKRQQERFRLATVVSKSKRGSDTYSSMLMNMPDVVGNVKRQDTKFQEDEDDLVLDARERKMLMEENDLLEQQLTTELDEVRLMHSKVVEIARVCTFLNAKVQEQHVQVENINTDAHRSTEYIKKGQIQLEEAVQSKKSSRKVIFYLFVIMGCSLLFLDWFM